MPEYVVTFYWRLRSLCIRNDWFSQGDNDQYERMFDANDTRNNFTIEEVALIIWVCSANVTREEVLEKLLEARAKYWEEIGFDGEKFIDEGAC